MPIEVLDPTFDEDAEPFSAAARRGSLQGATIAIISNGKKGTATFFDAVEHELRETYGVAEVIRKTKSNYSAPAEVEVMNDAEKWNAIISGIGD